MTEWSGLPPALLRQLDRVGLVSQRRLARQGQGERRSPLYGSSLQYADFRAYTAGDDPRQVDWNAYARSGELFVRLYEDEQILTVHLLIDVSGSMDFGAPSKRQMSLQLARALGYVALAGYDRVQVGFLADRTVGMAGPFWGQRQCAALFAALARAPSAARTDFAASVAGYLDRLKQPSLLIFLTDLLSPTAEAGLRRLATAHDEAVVIQVLAPQEIDPTPADDVRLVDRETGQSVELTLDLDTLARYRRRLDDWTERLAGLCHERNARYLRLSSGDDLERTVMRSLRERGILR